jgi:hypothetical protein
MIMDDTAQWGFTELIVVGVTTAPYRETSWKIYYSRTTRTSVRTAEDIYTPLLVGVYSPTGRYGPQRRFQDNIFA